ncbi:hypothetical protein D5O27_20670 [Salmonella enterica subsp. enterica serovar Enteritidis]|nr:hypothetical protein [Salmonella enterica subsp. enterica serovar Enteritidis]
MPMILVKKNPRGKVIRELSSEEETAVKTVCGLKKPATMALHNLANDILREMREYDAWLQCDCIPGDSPAMNFAALKNNTGTLYLSSFNHEHAPECPMYRQLSGNEEETSSGASRHPVSTRINYRNFLPPDDSNSVIRLRSADGRIICSEGYAHALYQLTCPVPVDSKLERNTLTALLNVASWLKRKPGTPELSLERPLFDTEVYVNGEKKYVLPDFIVTARAPDGKTARVVIETMGYEDSDYCARKSRQHTGMKQIGVLHTDPPKWLDNDHPPFEKHMYGVFMHLRY